MSSYKHGLSGGLYICCLCLTSLSLTCHGQESWPNNVSFSGLVETEFGTQTDYYDDTGNGISVPAVEFTLEASINKRVRSQITMLYEQDNTDFGINTAAIEIDMDFTNLVVGLIDLPFGAYESHMLSSPMTAEIGEIQKSAALFSREFFGIQTSAYIFNGDTDKPSETDDILSVYGLSLRYGSDHLAIGLDYITDLGESMGFIQSGIIPNDDHGGIALSAMFNTENAGLIFEAVTIEESFESEVLNFNNTGAKPQAYHVEAFYDSQFNNKPLGFSIAYANTRDSLALSLPKSRIAIAITHAVYEELLLGFEYNVSADYDTTDS